MPVDSAFATNSAALMSPRRLLLALALCGLGVGVVLFCSSGRPGDPVPQLAAVIGAMLLLVPAGFSWHKRIGGARRPRAWFVAHVLCGLLGAVLVAVHVREANFFSAPGAVVAALVFLVLQGTLARAVLGRRYAQLFGRAPAAFSPAAPNRDVLAKIIEQKVLLLTTLDPAASEALFSLQWRHWVVQPRRSWRFAQLASRERALVDAAAGVSKVLRYWRGLHLLMALLFVAGLFAHVLVVLFFAGYAAAGGQPYWWHLFAWGAGQ